MKLPARVRRLFRLPASRESIESEIDRELDFHLESRVGELIGLGASPQEARVRALREFGDVAKARAELAVIALRRIGSVRRTEWWSSLGQDVAFALRGLRRSPGFALVALGTLGLGIGANTAIFSGVDAVLLRSLPYRDLGSLVGVWVDGKEGGWASPGTFAALRGRGRTLEDLAAWSGWSFTLTGDGEAESVNGARITPNLFPLLGVVPALGRTFTEDESLPWPGQSYAGGSAVVLGHGLWQRRYGGDPDIVGRSLTIDGMSVPIVGVLPATFGFPSPQAELWLPVAVDPSEEPGRGGFLRMVGRLREGATPADAELELRDQVRQLRAEYPTRFTERFGEAAAVYPLREDLVGTTRRTLLVLFGVVGFVLLIACANVANLVLARASVRGREMSIRTALGAGRGRLLRQVLTEHVTLAGLGALLGLGLATWGAKFLAGALPADLTRGGEITVNGRVLAFTVGLTLAVGLVSGLAPALRGAMGGTRARGGEAGRGETAGRARRRLLEMLVVGELAVAVVLTAGAGLMVQSFWRLTREDPGFRPDGILTLRAAAPEAFYPRPPDRLRLTAQITDGLAALPGVTRVGAVHLLPLGGSDWSNALRVEGRELPPGQAGPNVHWRVTTPDYFGVAGIPLLAGRAFTAADREDAPGVAVINQALAARVFPGEDPIGRRVRTGFETDWVTVVGVVGDTRDLRLGGPPLPQLYRPHAQYALASMTYLVHTEGEPLDLALAARAVVAGADPNVPVSLVQPLEDVVSASLAQPRLLTLLLGGFGGVSLRLSTLGIYGVITYAVGQRTREFGIRLALGARPDDVLRLVLGSGSRLAALGLVAGLGGAWMLTRVLRETLYEIEPRDPLTFIGVAVLLGGVALLGCYVPARRAARVDPATSLGG